MEPIIELLRAQPQVFLAVVFAVGLLVGSFLNVVIHRLPIMMQREWAEQCASLNADDSEHDPASSAAPGTEPYNLVVPRSACPGCGHRITALENIPVISYLVLRGRCRSCQAPISMRYPVVELFTALLVTVVAWRFGFGAEALAGIALSFALVALSGIDMDTQYLPDSITLPLIWAGLLLSLFHGQTDAQVLFISPRDAIIGAAAGYLSLWSVYHLFRLVTGKEGMGYGDFKLLSALGAWLGWQMLPLIVLLSAFVGAVVGVSLIALRRQGREVPIPFGPYLAAAGWIALLYGEQIVSGYLRMSGLG